MGVFNPELEEEEAGVAIADDPSLGGLFESIPVVVRSNDACFGVSSAPYTQVDDEESEEGDESNADDGLGN